MGLCKPGIERGAKITVTSSKDPLKVAFLQKVGSVKFYFTI